MYRILKRRNKGGNQTSTKATTVLCIPGNWNNRAEVVSVITQNNLDEYVLAGILFLNLKTFDCFKLKICERDDSLIEPFKWAGTVNRFSEEFLYEIDNHKYVIYLSAKTKDIESVKAIAIAGNAILKSGGIGVKVENGGKRSSSLSSQLQLFCFQT